MKINASGGLNSRLLRSDAKEHDENECVSYHYDHAGHDNSECEIIAGGQSYAFCKERSQEETTIVAAQKLLRSPLVKIMLLTSLWWMSSIVVILEMKMILSDMYPHSFAFTSFTQVTTGVLAFFISRICNIRVEMLPALQRAELARLVLMGLLQGIEIALTNKALEFLDVAARTMITATSVLFMMVSAACWGLERPNPLHALAGTLILAGGVSQSLDKNLSSDEGNVKKTFGSLIQVSSMLLSTQRWALTQVVLQRSPCDSALGRMSKLEILAITLPITGLVCMLMSLATEYGAYSQAFYVLQCDLFWRVLYVSVALGAMLYAELQLVKMLSAVAFSVLSAVHQIPIVLAGVLLQHNIVQIWSGFGFFFCISGAIVYAAAHREERVEQSIRCGTRCLFTPNVHLCGGWQAYQQRLGASISSPDDDSLSLDKLQC